MAVSEEHGGDRMAVDTPAETSGKKQRDYTALDNDITGFKDLAKQVCRSRSLCCKWLEIRWHAAY